MHVKNLVICDCEETYARALAFYLMKKTEAMFQVQVCSDLSHVKKVSESMKIDLLLISEHFSVAKRRTLDAEIIFVLSEGNLKEKDSAEIVLYKYQSGESILGELLKQCDDYLCGKNDFSKKPGRKDKKIIGVFSPVHGIGKTSYSLKLGEQISASSNVLYLNLEIYGGLEGHFEEGDQTLSDVLYYARQEKGNLGLILAKLVYHRHGLDYILPMPISEDIKSVDVSEWIDLAEKILEESIYEVVILDIDEGIQKVYDLLRICTEIHVPLNENRYSLAKVQQFKQELSILGYEDILKKLVLKELKPR